MLETLRFVRGAVSSKDLVPVLTHFCIKDGCVEGQDGRLVIRAPCPEIEGVSAVVPADKFLRAVDHCDGDPTITITDNTMRLKRGKFSARLQLMNVEEYPAADVFDPHSEGDSRSFSLIQKILGVMKDFVSKDASRPWSCSVFFKDGKAYATNNVILVRADIPWDAPPLVVPSFCVEEIVRIGKPPVSISWGDNALRIGYGGGWWLQSRMVDGTWPSIEHFDNIIDGSEGFIDITGEMRTALEKLRPFVPDAKMPIIELGPTGMSTQEGLSHAEVDVGVLPVAVFRAEALQMVFDYATQWDPFCYPGPVPFKGPELSGVLSGIRK